MGVRAIVLPFLCVLRVVNACGVVPGLDLEVCEGAFEGEDAGEEAGGVCGGVDVLLDESGVGVFGRVWVLWGHWRGRLGGQVPLKYVTVAVR